jgi:hypothetical protein
LLIKFNFKKIARDSKTKPMSLLLRFKLKWRKSTLKKKDARLKFRRKNLPLNQREPRKQLPLNKKPKKTPMRSMRPKLRSFWNSLKNRNNFFNNNTN